MNELVWRKSSRSSTEPQCVELAFSPREMHIRDSKNPDGDQLTWPLARLGSLVAMVAHRDHDQS